MIEIGRRFWVLSEDNDREGEIWNVALPIEGNEDFIQAVEEYMAEFGEADYYFSEKHRTFEIDEYAVDVLLEYGQVANYYNSWRKVEVLTFAQKADIIGRLKDERENAFYKGLF